MRTGWFGTIATWLAGAGLATAQSGPAMRPGDFGPRGDISPVAGVFTQAPQPVIPPSIPLAGPGVAGGQLPYPDAPIYPPPANFEAGPANYGGGGGGGIDPAREVPKFWANFEYVLWFPKSQPVDFPLLTTGSAASQGILNRGTTTVLVGNQNLAFNTANGFRVETGIWFDPDRRKGFMLGGFLLERVNNNYFVQGDASGNPVLARPFFDTTTGTQSSLVIASPGTASGSASVITNTQTFGVEGNYLVNLFRGDPADRYMYSVNFMYGFRYIDLKENLDIISSSTAINGTLPTTAFGTPVAGSQQNLIVLDQFKTHNMFFGGTLGFNHEFRLGRLVISGTTKLSVGDMYERAEVNGTTALQTVVPSTTVTTRTTTGTTTTTTPGSTASASAFGGLLANSANIGKDRNDQIAVVPEFTLGLGYQLTPRILGSIGYNFLYLNRVARPGHSDTMSQVNSALVPASANFGNTLGATPRADLFQQTDFYVQGVTFSLHFQY